MFAKSIFFISCFFIIVTLFSCSKEAGEGGTSTIYGTVWVIDYDKDGNLKGEYFGFDEDVFIVYGDNDVIDEKTSTNYNGKYEFNYLRKGTYTIYAYSNCDTCISEMKPVIQTVEITDNNSAVEAPQLVVIR
ncbi:MAG: hypothetical protein IPI59_08645 [Sphingobacteriales bacterium]|jgi:hypothetical protein|nr:hypothetical protein [Sphingobacteriales bacterium]MBP9141904.1 hypothetical protein [Chitinophagales bacterium]MDA0198804.1 hypothetical protein [Bacteroidota bacterium]MBK6889880.1 hypothetical protein [Sphingobacteriales bacterium]MBK7527601.1 hypothetical protein [Sphingobacteriales bacterium]